MVLDLAEAPRGTVMVYLYAIVAGSFDLLARIVMGYPIDPLLELTITVAVVFHEIPQGMTSALIMREAKWSRAGVLLASGWTAGSWSRRRRRGSSWGAC